MEDSREYKEKIRSWKKVMKGRKTKFELFYTGTRGNGMVVHLSFIEAKSNTNCRI